MPLGRLEPRVLRTLDAIHLAAALAVGDDLDVVVTYDERMTQLLSSGWSLLPRASVSLCSVIPSARLRTWSMER